MALVDLSAVEQRYRAVVAVKSGRSVTEVAAAWGVSRQSVQSWIRRYEAGGLGGLVDRSHRPDACPHQAAAEVEAAVAELRRHHPRWGPRRIAHELAKAGDLEVVPSRMTVYRILARQGLVEPKARRRRREDYKRWAREAPMQLWQTSDRARSQAAVDGVEGPKAFLSS